MGPRFALQAAVELDSDRTVCYGGYTCVIAAQIVADLCKSEESVQAPHASREDDDGDRFGRDQRTVKSDHDDDQ